MAGTKAGGQKAARTFKKKTTRRQRRAWAAEGGSAKVKKGFAVSGKAREAGAEGGKKRAAKYQDPNFDKDLYRARRKAGLPGVDKRGIPGSSLSPEEYLRRTNPEELERQQEAKKRKRAKKGIKVVGDDSKNTV